MQVRHLYIMFVGRVLVTVHVQEGVMRRSDDGRTLARGDGLLQLFELRTAQVSKLQQKGTLIN